MTNVERAERAFGAIEFYAGDDDTTPEERVMDILTDIRHYCESIGAPYEKLDEIAHEHYAEELADEADLDEEVS